MNQIAKDDFFWQTRSGRSIFVTFRAQCAVVMRFNPCRKTLLFKIEVSSKLHLVDLIKGYNLSQKIFCNLNIFA